MPRKISYVKDDLLRFLAFVQEGVNAGLALDIAEAVIEEMLNMIAKGISPIQGKGRFPAYKAAGLRKELRKQKSAIAKELRKNKKNLLVFRRKNRRQILAIQRANVEKKLAGAERGYPFNTEEYKAGRKKPRPVNLFLTGDFLAHLTFEVTQAGKNTGLEIGFFDEKQAAKEQGHREGANGQPERPVIPIGTEDFAITIQNVIFAKIEEALDRRAASAS